MQSSTPLTLRHIPSTPLPEVVILPWPIGWRLFLEAQRAQVEAAWLKTASFYR